MIPDSPDALDASSSRRSGGIGRRAGFKIPLGQLSVGSSPTSGSHRPEPVRGARIRVGTIGLGKGLKTEHVRQMVARRIGPISISDIEADCIGVSRDMIRIVLRQLRDKGVITLQGKGRGAKWVRRHD